MTTLEVHSPDCAPNWPHPVCGVADEPRKTFWCPGCERDVGWCMGASDELGELCDDCAADVLKKREVWAPETIDRAIEAEAKAGGAEP